MAKQPTLTNEVVELLIEGKSTKEIMEETGCSKSTVTVARKRVDARKAEIDGELETTEDETDAAIDSFIEKIHIKPDADVLTDKEDEKVKDIDYECPKCGATWFASPTEKQESCPTCGQEFN